MKTRFFQIVVMALCVHAAAQAATVEMVSGPDLSVSYEPDMWKPLAALNAPEPGHFQTMTWELQKPGRLQITVVSHPERKDEGEYRRETLSSQRLRGDPAKLVNERRQSLAGRDWLVLEYHNPNTRPERREVHYFLPTDEGSLRLIVVAAEADLPAQQEAVDAFLRQIRLK